MTLMTLNQAKYIKDGEKGYVESQQWFFSVFSTNIHFVSGFQSHRKLLQLYCLIKHHLFCSSADSFQYCLVINCCSSMQPCSLKCSRLWDVVDELCKCLVSNEWLWVFIYFILRDDSCINSSNEKNVGENVATLSKELRYTRRRSIDLILWKNHCLDEKCSSSSMVLKTGIIP